MPSIQLSIADPCHENWNDMLPEEKGRFCLGCQKTVVDFTSMTDGQVFDYFKHYKGNTCGQFTPGQLDRDIIKPATYGIGRWKYFWQILLPAVFTFYKSEAQTLKGKVAPKALHKVDTNKPVSIVMGMIAAPLHIQPPKYKLQGVVTDEKQQPVPFATISSDDGRLSTTDSTGHFSIETALRGNLTFSYVGYETKSISCDSAIAKGAVKSVEVDKSKNTIIITTNVQLQVANNVLGEVIAIGYGNNILTGRVGGVSVRTRRFSFSKLKNLQPANDSLQFKIFPNPIQKGQDFQIKLQVKKTGSHLVKITDATGKLMLEEKLEINSSNQTETISGKNLQQAGIYIITVSNLADKKSRGLTGKLVVQ